MVGVAPRGLGAIGAVVARFVHTEEVTGSNPVSPTSITPGEVQFEGEDPVGVQDTCRMGPGTSVLPQLANSRSAADRSAFPRGAPCPDNQGPQVVLRAS